MEFRPVWILGSNDGLQVVAVVELGACFGRLPSEELVLHPESRNQGGNTKHKLLVPGKCPEALAWLPVRKPLEVPS